MEEWLSDKYFESTRRQIIPDLMCPNDIKFFKKSVQNLSKYDSPLQCGHYFIYLILTQYSNDLEKYKIPASLGKLLPLYAVLFFKSLDNKNTLQEVVSFIVKSIPFCEQQISYQEIVPAMLLKIFQLNNIEILEISKELIHSALYTSYIKRNLFKGMNLADLWETAFIKHENTGKTVGKMILESLSTIRFLKMEPIKIFLETALSYITQNNIPSNFAQECYEYIAYTIKHLDCTNFIVQIMPKLAQIATSFASLKCFESFLVAPVMYPAVTWTPLSEICASKDATSVTLHSALEAMVNANVIPPLDCFSFDSFAKRYKELSEDDHQHLFTILNKCDSQTKCNFIAACFPIQETQVNMEHVMKMVTETQWDEDIVFVLNALITNVSPELLQQFFTDIPDYFAMCNAACDQIFQTCKASVPVLMKLSEIAKNNFELVSSLISKVLDRTSTEITIPQIVLELSNGVPAFLLDTFANVARRISSFNHEFFKQDYKPALIQLTKSLSGLGLIAALAVDGPVREIDQFVDENWNLFENYDQKILDNLMRGLPPKSESQGFIRIPSIIPHITNLQANNPYDKFLIAKTLKNPTRDQMKIFISQNLGGIKNLKTVTEDPELLYLSTIPTEPQKAVIQFHPQARQCLGNILIKPVTSFWFFPYEVSGRTIIIQYGQKTISLREGGLQVFDGPVISPFQTKVWHMITLMRPEKQQGNEPMMTSVYVDEDFAGTFNLPKSKTLILGNSECSSEWLLSSSFIVEDNISKYKDAASYVSKIYQKGPYYSTFVAFNLNLGPKIVPYEGILRYIPTLGGKSFIFQYLLDCEDDQPQKFHYYLKTAMNLFDLKIFSETQFFRLLRYTLYMKEKLYSKEVENIIFNGITEKGRINWKYAFLLYCDFRLLTSDYIAFSFVDRLIEFPSYINQNDYSQFLNYLIDTFAFFHLSQNIKDQCFNLIEIFVQRIPSLLKRIANVLVSLPHLETDDLNKDFEIVTNRNEEKETDQSNNSNENQKQTIEDKSNESKAIRSSSSSSSQIDSSLSSKEQSIDSILTEEECKEQKDKQYKLFKMLTRSPDVFVQIFTPEEGFGLASLLDDKLALEFLEFLAKAVNDNTEFFSLSDFKKLKPLFRRQSKNIKLWLILFSFLTGKKYQTIEDYQTKEVTFIRTDLLSIMFGLIRNIISPENDKMCYSILQTLYMFVKKVMIPLTNFTKAIQSMCSLGFNEQYPAPMRHSLYVTEESPRVKRKLSSKKLLQSFDLSNSYSTNSLLKEIQDFDPITLKETIEYLSLPKNVINVSRQKSSSTIRINQKSEELLPDNIQDYYALSSTTLICEIASLCLLEAAIKQTDAQLKQALIQLTIYGSDTNPIVAAKMHQEIFLNFLAMKEFATNSIPLEQKIIIFQFLVYRILEGWWDDALFELFSLVLPLLSASQTEFKDASASFVIASLSKCKNQKEKIQIAKMLLDSPFFDAILHDSDIFASFMNLIINLELGEDDVKNESENIYHLIAKRLSDQDLKKALEEGKQIEWLFANQTVSQIFQSYYNSLLQDAQANSQMIFKERQYISGISKNAKYNFNLRTNLAHATFLKRGFRFQFFIHFNVCSSAIDYAIDLLFKHKKNIGIDKKYYEKRMYGIAPNPLVPPMKLLPSFIDYDAKYAKQGPKITLPMSVHEQRFKTIIKEINEPERCAKCYEDWRMPKFIPYGITPLARSVFKPVAPFVPCAILVTPESLPCVLVQTKEALQIILNASYQSNQIILHDMNEIFICHSMLFESSPFDVFGTSSLFCNHSVLIYPWSDIVTTIPRKYIHENTALDIYTYTGSSVTLIMSESDRKAIINKTNPIKPSHQLRGPLFYNKLSTQIPIEDVEKLWYHFHALSTFEYLLFLNAQGLRSFNDLSQYPVFPWVIGDYTSENGYTVIRDLTKPLGMLGYPRSERFLTMYQETEKHYFYGTHYSYPAAVFHYMMRVEPYTLYNVNLHSGFDHKDRLFCNISESWKSAALSNQADLKELIPQFFCIYEMLTNVNNLPLAERTDGTNLSNVTLPVWANSPLAFMWINREALESDGGSDAISEWIDLVFGYKQKGQAAIDAHNLFHPLTYEDCQLENTNDAREMKAQIDAINNFGQCPHQLFTAPHPKYELKSGRKIGTNLLDNGGEDLDLNVVQLKPVIQNSANLRVTNSDSYILCSKKLEHIIDSTTIIVKDRYFDINKKIQISDNNFLVRCSALSSDGLFLATGALTGIVAVFLCTGGPLILSMRTLCQESICVVQVSTHLSIVVAASHKHLFLIDLTSSIIMQKVEVENLKFIAIDETCYFIVACSTDTVYIYSQNLELICSFTSSNAINSSSESLMNTSFPPITSLGVNDSIVWNPYPFFVTGHQDGSVLIWYVDFVNKSLEFLHVMKVNASPISSICIACSGCAIIAAGSDGSANLAVASGIGRPVLRSEYFSTCPICCQALNDRAANICPVCGLPICRNCWAEECCTICKAKLAVENQMNQEENAKNEEEDHLGDDDQEIDIAEDSLA